MRPRLHAFLLILALLFAQGGMLAHAASHLAAAGQADDTGLVADAGCELCVGYAQLAGGAPLPGAPSLPVSPDGPVILAADVCAVVSPFLTCSRARAPPTLLS